jgi:hypothetical protein
MLSWTLLTLSGLWGLSRLGSLEMSKAYVSCQAQVLPLRVLLLVAPLVVLLLPLLYDVVP